MTSADPDKQTSVPKFKIADDEEETEYEYDDEEEPEYEYDGDTGCAFINGEWRVVSSSQWERWQRS
jgi:uncharacterized membrane protein (UPF0182 family)